MNSIIESITIKGTRHGLLIAIREDADFSAVLATLGERLDRDKAFLASSSMSVDLGWREVLEAQLIALEETLLAHQISLAGILSTSLNTRTLAERRGHKAIIGRLGLAQHMGRNLKREQQVAPPTAAPEPEAVAPAIALGPPVVSEPIPAEPAPAAPVAESSSDEKEQEATLYIRRTLRSGQRAIYPGNVVVMGDVNPGAEIEAEGDVLVIGTLRGRVHAGSGGNPQAHIWALVMQATQLRLGEVVWSTEERPKFPGPMRAVLQKNVIQLLPGA